MRTFKGLQAPPDGQHSPLRNNDGDDDDNKNGVGEPSNSGEANAAPAVDPGASSARSNSHSQQAQQDGTESGTGERGSRSGSGARGDLQVEEHGIGEGKGVGVRADAKGISSGPTGEDALELAVAVPLTAAGGGQVPRSDRHGQSCTTSSGSKINSSGTSEDSGGPVGGLLERRKSVATMLDRTRSHAAMVDRGSKKKAALTTQRSSGTAAGNGVHGSAKKNGSTTNAAAKKDANVGANIMAEERHHQRDKGVGRDPSEAPVETIEAIDLPKHVLTEDNCTFWVR